jgi:Mg-chelatase subunit ChlD
MVLDRSGSMQPVAGDVVGGFNAFLAEQRTAADTARVTLVQFDSQDPYEVLIDGADLATVTDLDPSRYQPRGTTPLYDAVGRAITAADERIAKRADRGESHEDQVVAIITDGLENASAVFTHTKVFAMIEDRHDRGWAFVFIGANQDAYAEGGRVGFVRGNIKEFTHDGPGVKEAFGAMSHETTRFRQGSARARNTQKGKFFEDQPKGN